MPSRLSRVGREILGQPKLSKNYQVTALLRTYNGAQHIDEIIADLDSQESQEFFTLVVDNHSEDLTWEIVQAWVRGDPLRRAGVRNPFNQGSIGSLFSNLDIVESEWVIDFHQDDRYEASHVKEIQTAIGSLPADTEVVALSTEMGSISTTGKKIATPPRASWFIDKEASRIWFAASTIRLQAFPIPAAAYRLEALIRSEPPWINSTFGDSEISITLRSFGQLLWIPKKTMHYRENPSSESHSIHKSDQVRGLESGFARVVSSKWFLDDSARLNHDEFHYFSKYLIESIQMRIGVTHVSSHILSSYFENVLLLRGYDCGTALTFVKTAYREEDLTSKIIEGVIFGSVCEPENPIASFGVVGTELGQADWPLEPAISRGRVAERYRMTLKSVPHNLLRLGWKRLPTALRIRAMGKLWDIG